MWIYPSSFILRKPFVSIAINKKKVEFDGVRCLFSTFLRLQGDHHCACAQKWCHSSFFYIKALRPKMTKIASRGSCLKLSKTYSFQQIKQIAFVEENRSIRRLYLHAMLVLRDSTRLSFEADTDDWRKWKRKRKFTVRKISKYEDKQRNKSWLYS